MNRTNTAAGSINDTTRRNKNIRKEVKGQIYKTVIRSLIIHAAETLPDLA